jgi:outer membrane protein assembly factor BamD (BamD/ComL family)
MVERAADSLGEEARLIREAQIGLRAGDVAGARKSLDAHAQTFPRGVLRDERLVLEVLVLCAEGRVESARRAADELLRTHPLSSHSESLRASCAGTSMP